MLTLIEQIVRVNRIDSRSCGRRAEAVVLIGRHGAMNPEATLQHNANS